MLQDVDEAAVVPTHGEGHEIHLRAEGVHLETDAGMLRHSVVVGDNRARARHVAHERAVTEEVVGDGLRRSGELHQLGVALGGALADVVEGRLAKVGRVPVAGGERVTDGDISPSTTRYGHNDGGRGLRPVLEERRGGNGLRA